MSEVDLVASGWLEEGIELPDGRWDALLTVVDGLYGVEPGQVLRVLFDERPDIAPAGDDGPPVFLLTEAEGAAVRVVSRVGLGLYILWDAADLLCSGEGHPAMAPLVRRIVQQYGVRSETAVVTVCPGETHQRFLHLEGWDAVVEGPPPRVTEISRKARVWMAPLVLDAGDAQEPRVLGKTIMGYDKTALDFLAEVPLPRAALYLDPDEPVAVVVAHERPIPPVIVATKCYSKAVD